MQKLAPKRKSQIILKWILSGVFLIMLIATFMKQLNPERLQQTFPIEYLRVEGDIFNLNPEGLKKVLLPELQTDFLFADLNAIESAARKEPWVDRAEAIRVWPDTVALRIEEQVPAARWGDDSLLNARGERFKPSRVEATLTLPQLIGPDGQEHTVLTMQRAIDLKLKPWQLEVETLRLSDRRAWTAEITGGIELVFGHQDPLAALNRLLTLLPKLGQDRLPTMKRLDLRYPNGFAVVWKQEPITPAVSFKRTGNTRT